MGKVYTDAEMMLASQIAYMDIDVKYVGTYSMGQIIDMYLDYGIYEDGKWKLKNPNVSEEYQRQFERAVSVVELAKKNGISENEWRNWKIADQCNDNQNTGFCGCLIDTGDGNALIASRGSESYDLKQLEKDWIDADFGLVNNYLTGQQNKAQEYIEELYAKYGSKYQKFGITGHSLGGNLAIHMGINAPDEMRDKIDSCTSYDGPGFSEKYIRAHRENIEQGKSYLKHYKYTIVGTLLNNIPGVPAISVEAEGMLDGQRHSLVNVELDEKGNVIRNDESDVRKQIGEASRFIDNFSKKVEDLYYDHLAANVSGEYEIYTQTVGCYSEELRTAAKRLDEVNEEIEQLRKTWKNWTASGGYYRSHLWRITCGLERDIHILDLTAKATDRILQNYEEEDQKAELLFA